jgi:hypothetical protein
MDASEEFKIYEPADPDPAFFCHRSKIDLWKAIKARWAYNNAVDEHCRPRKEDGAIDLAEGARAWREIESLMRGWRTVPRYLFKNIRVDVLLLRNKALRFESKFHDALAKPDANFFRNLSDALRLSDSEIDQQRKSAPTFPATSIPCSYAFWTSPSTHLDTNSAVIFAWKDLGGLYLARPSWEKVRRLAETRIDPRTDRQWERTRKDPWIAAMLDI